MKITVDNFFTASDGAHIYFEEQGQGAALIMVPGFLCTGRFFEKNAEALSKEFRVITMDPRGQGFSSKTTGGNTIRRHAQDVRELVDHLRLESVVLLGWSLAASIVAEYAVQFDQYRLAGLVMMDGSLFPFSNESWNHHRGRDYNVQNWHSVYMPLFYNPTEFYEKFFQRIGLREEDREWVTAECRLAMPWSALELHYDFCHTDNVSKLPKITVPTAFFGAASKDYGLEMPNTFASRVSGYSEVVEFYRSGHLMFLYEAEKFNTELARFVRKANKLSRSGR